MSPWAQLRRRWFGDLALGVACLAPLLLPRVVLLSDLRTPLVWADLSGAAADIAAGALCWLALVLLGRVARPLALLIAVGWVLIHYANLEHIDALGVMLHAGNAHLVDTTFLRGSALAITRPALLVGLLFAGVAPVALALYWLGEPRRLLPPFAIGLAAGTALLLLPQRQVSVWRQGTPLFHQLSSMLSSPAELRREAHGVRSPELEALGRGELVGSRWLDAKGARQNVIIIVLESISGAMVDNVAAAHGLPASGLMPRLSRISARHLSWANFISQDRMTNRGEYSLLCGDHPKLTGGTSKMTMIALGGARQCLPRFLARAGYTTVYAQAAPLAFMFKDRFMPRAGFQRVLGDEHYGEGQATSQWGVDDVSFFEQTIPLVAKLATQRKPYFLTLLTVGTHHPYLIPDSFAERPSLKGLRRKHVAVRWADRGVGRFIDALKARGLLRDTLVLITSDESMGAPQTLPSRLRRLSENWGLLVVISPRAQQPRVIEAWAVTSDLAISVLDYLGLTGDTSGLVGRSLFRQPAPRTIVFGNVYRRLLHAIRADGTLHQCSHDFQRCEVFRVPQRGLFSRPLTALESQPAVELLRGAARLAAHVEAPGELVRKIPLVQRDKLPVHGDGRVTMLIGGQFFKVAAGTQARAILDFEIVGEGAGVSSTLVLTDHAKPLGRFELPLLSAGDKLRLNLVHVPAHAIDQLQLFFYARMTFGQKATVHVRQATMDFSSKRRDGAAYRVTPSPRLLLSRKKMRIKAASYTFRLADRRHFSPLGCARRTKQGVVVDPSCGDKPVIAGPDLMLHGPLDLVARASIRGRAGRSTIRAVILTHVRDERVVLARASVVVSPGKQAELKLRAKLKGFARKVRLQLHHEGRGGALIESLGLRATP